MMSLIFAVLAGISVTMQNSLNGLMTPIIGAFGVSLASFVAQTIPIVFLLLITEHSFKSVRKIPLWYGCSGFISVMVVAILGICVSRMGSAVTQCCSVAGQILMSAFVEHFGLFGNTKSSFRRNRIPGFVIILGGVLAMNLIGGSASSHISLQYLLLSVALGACAIIVRSLNSSASKYSGSLFAAGTFNSISGVLGSLLALFLFSGFRPDFSGFTHVPAPYYLAGVFGAACLVCNIMSYRNAKIFYSTIFMLIGQVVTGIVMDILVFHTLSVGRCIGIAIVFAGIMLDKFLTK